LQNVTRDDLGGFNLDQVAVTKDGSLESKSFLEFLDNGAGLELLDETDGGVEQEKGADDTEIDPVLKTGGEDSGSLGTSRQ
jgi:hypothetical protein